MYVRVSQDGAHVNAQVLDVEDLKRLSVRLDGVDGTDAGHALQEQGLGELQDGFAWLVIERLRLSGPGDTEWSEGFAAMIRYAAKENWLDDTGTLVRAHIE